MGRRGTGSLVIRFLQWLGSPLFRLLVWSLEKISQPPKTIQIFPPVKRRKPKSKLRLKLHWPKVKLNWPRLLVSLIIFSLVFLLFNFYFLILKDLPDPNKLAGRQPLLTTKIYDRNGQLLYKIYRNQNRTLVKINEVPIQLIQAVVAIEDAEFYQHHGLSLRGILRALKRNLQEGKLVGGSTITQQLVKNALLTPAKTWSRKTKEVLLALEVEWKFSKDEIMQMYLNEVGFGGTSYGLEEASWSYFGKSATKLSQAEAALLAGLPASPTTYSPFGAHPELAKQRQEQVLRRMREEKFITKEEEEKAKKEELRFAPPGNEIQAPHFVMYVRELLEQKYGQEIVENGGLEVQTSLDLALKKSVQKIVQEEIDKVKPLKIGNGAALVTNPATGEILAMVGSRDYFDLEHDGNVNVTIRPRQPGSAIKPVNYAVALEKKLITPATVLNDVPSCFQVVGQKDYCQVNYDGQFHGSVTVRFALANSYNLPAVKVLALNSLEEVVKKGQQVGLTTWKEPANYGLSLTLGGGEVTMYDLAAAYSAFANLGVKQDLWTIKKVDDLSGKTIFEQPPAEGRRVLPIEVAYLIDHILLDNGARSAAFGSSSWLVVKNHPEVLSKPAQPMICAIIGRLAGPLQYSSRLGSAIMTTRR